LGKIKPIKNVPMKKRLPEIKREDFVNANEYYKAEYIQYLEEYKKRLESEAEWFKKIKLMQDKIIELLKERLANVPMPETSFSKN
jgi:hypothetical protein